MKELEWIDNFTQTERLQVWAWLEGEIKLNGATGTTLVRIRYFKSLTAPTGGASTLAILDSETFLAARTASLAAAVIGANLEKAAVLQQDASAALANLLSTAVKGRQNQPVRRRKFRAFRNRFGSLYR